MPEEPIDTAGAVRTPSGKRGTVLIIDDDAGMLGLLRRILEREHTTYTAFSVPEARSILASHDIDVVVCDHFMPDENGLSFLISLQRLSPFTQRILMTGAPNDQLIFEAINAGHILHYISKPIQKKVVLDFVRDGVETHDALALQQKEMESKDEEIQKLHSLPGVLHHMKQTALAAEHHAASIVAAGSFSMFLLVTFGVVIGAAALLILYYLKAAFGLDFLADAHLGL